MPQEIELSRIRIDGGTQPRAEIDIFAVEEYAGHMARGVDFPPVDLVFDGAAYWLYDGFHRVHAGRKAGKTTIAANIRPGTVEDARWLALTANQTHGLRRTNADKRRAVESALAQKPGTSDRAIADHVGVGHQLVGEVRRQLDDSSSSAPRLGRDGKTRNMPTPAAPVAEFEDALFADEAGDTAAARVPLGDSDDEDDDDREPDDLDIDVMKQLESEAPQRGDYEQARDFAEKAEVVRDRVEAARSPLPMATPHAPAVSKGETITLAEWNDLHPDLRLTGGVLDTLQEGSTKKLNSQGDNEKIEWALWSWNPVTGCLHNCPYCYARDIATLGPTANAFPNGFEPSIIPARLAAPRNTAFPAAKIEAALALDTDRGRTLAMGLRNVFTCSMADLFGRWVPKEWIDAVLRAVEDAPRWNFLFLTKFPQRMAEFDFPDNAWVGTTVDCQARVANAERAFEKIKAGVKWLSCEPLIEPLQFSDLGVFDWLVIGGSSRSSETPEWHPPRDWVNALEAKATSLGVKVYEKANLLERTRQYPGIDADVPTEAPPQLRYLPS